MDRGLASPLAQRGLRTTFKQEDDFLQRAHARNGTTGTVLRNVPEQLFTTMSSRTTRSAAPSQRTTRASRAAKPRTSSKASKPKPVAVCRPPKLTKAQRDARAAASQNVVNHTAVAAPAPTSHAAPSEYTVFQMSTELGALKTMLEAGLIPADEHDNMTKGIFAKFKDSIGHTNETDDHVLDQIHDVLPHGPMVAATISTSAADELSRVPKPTFVAQARAQLQAEDDAVLTTGCERRKTKEFGSASETEACHNVEVFELALALESNQIEQDHAIAVAAHNAELEQDDPGMEASQDQDDVEDQKKAAAEVRIRARTRQSARRTKAPGRYCSTQPRQTAVEKKKRGIKNHWSRFVFTLMARNLARPPAWAMIPHRVTLTQAHSGVIVNAIEHVDLTVLEDKMSLTAAWESLKAETPANWQTPEQAAAMAATAAVQRAAAAVQQAAVQQAAVHQEAVVVAAEQKTCMPWAPKAAAVVAVGAAATAAATTATAAAAVAEEAVQQASVATKAVQHAATVQHAAQAEAAAAMTETETEEGAKCNDMCVTMDINMEEEYGQGRAATEKEAATEEQFQCSQPSVIRECSAPRMAVCTKTVPELRAEEKAAAAVTDAPPAEVEAEPAGAEVAPAAATDEAADGRSLRVNDEFDGERANGAPKRYVTEAEAKEPAAVPAVGKLVPCPGCGRKYISFACTATSFRAAADSVPIKLTSGCKACGVMTCEDCEVCKGCSVAAAAAAAAHANGMLGGRLNDSGASWAAERLAAEVQEREDRVSAAALQAGARGTKTALQPPAAAPPSLSGAHHTDAATEAESPLPMVPAGGQLLPAVAAAAEEPPPNEKRAATASVSPANGGKSVRHKTTAAGQTLLTDGIKGRATFGSLADRNDALQKAIAASDIADG